MTNVNDVIEHYKSELLGEAELDRGDLKEIEDHLRTLAEELRERGMPALEAVRAACERLGDPRAVAREHARVHSPFGARLSRARSISAAICLLSVEIENYRHFRAMSGAFPAWGIVTALTLVMVIALIARATWARPIVLGSAGFFATYLTLHQITDFAGQVRWLIPLAGTVLFVMPWRRNELRRAGYALALQAFAFGAAADANGRLMIPAAPIAFSALLIAVIGTVLRARWAALASAVGAVALVVSMIEIAPMYFQQAVQFSVRFALIEGLPRAAVQAAAVAAAAFAAFASWRSARANVGTLRYVMR